MNEDSSVSLPAKVPRQRGDRRLLFSTNIRSTQQDPLLREKIQLSKARLFGKKFRTRVDPPNFCRKHKIALIDVTDKKVSSIRFRTLPCNSWTCPSCQMKKALRVKYYLRTIILLNDLSHFLTLTLDPCHIPPSFKSENQNRTHLYITKLFNHFVTVLKRKSFRYFNTRKNRYYKFSLQNSTRMLKYIWVVEFQDNGNAHLHILVNQFVPAEVIRKLWSHVGGGHILKIEKIRTIAGISHYLTDYIVKGISDLESNGFQYFQKRYAISRSCTRPDKIKAEKLSQPLPWLDKALDSENFKECDISFEAGQAIVKELHDR